MAERVYIGNDGNDFRFRVSRPGFSARTAEVDKLAIYENMQSIYPNEMGYYALAGGQVVDVALSRGYTRPPFVLIRCAQNILPGPNAYYASLRAGTNVIRLYNRLTTQIDVKYCIFGEQPYST